MRIALAPRIIVDPAVRSGKPVIEGTRVPVDLVLGKLAGGMTMEEVAAEYEITMEDFRAVVEHGSLTAERCQVTTD